MWFLLCHCLYFRFWSKSCGVGGSFSIWSIMSFFSLLYWIIGSSSEQIKIVKSITGAGLSLRTSQLFFDVVAIVVTSSRTETSVKRSNYEGKYTNKIYPYPWVRFASCFSVGGYLENVTTAIHWPSLRRYGGTGIPREVDVTSSWVILQSMLDKVEAISLQLL